MMWAGLILQADAPPPAVPPPLAQSVADCAAPTYASDITVCAAPDLLALDRQLAALLPLPDLPSVIVEEQGAWFRRSRMCAMRADQRVCLAAAYRERIAVAQALRTLASVSPRWRQATCAKRPARTARLSLGAIAVESAGQIRIAVASAQPSTWVPFAWYAAAGTRLQLGGTAAPLLRCTVNMAPL